MRLPKEKEFDKSVFGEWYNADNISVLQLLLAIVTIKSKFFDDFGQKNSQIDHTTCLNKIKQAIIDVKNDVYNIYRIRNMLVHSSNTKSKLLEDYSKRNKEYSLRLILEIRKHLFATESDTEIQPISTYFTRMIIDANVAFEAVVNNDMDKFRKWIIQ